MKEHELWTESEVLKEEALNRQETAFSFLDEMEKRDKEIMAKIKLEQKKKQELCRHKTFKAFFGSDNKIFICEACNKMSNDIDIEKSRQYVSSITACPCCGAKNFKIYRKKGG